VAHVVMLYLPWGHTFMVLVVLSWKKPFLAHTCNAIWAAVELVEEPSKILKPIERVVR
jgi:hypothetical protein